MLGVVVCVCACEYICMCLCVRAYVCLSVSVSVSVCLCVCVCACVPPPPFATIAAICCCVNDTTAMFEAVALPTSHRPLPLLSLPSFPFVLLRCVTALIGFIINRYRKRAGRFR